MRILLSGAGIAGSAAALLLHRDGHALTVIDKAPSFQKLGYGLSLKSFGLEVMKDLDLLDNLRQHEISMKAVQVLDSHGALLHEYDGDDAAKASQGAAIVYRSELHEVLYLALTKALPIHFGAEIRSLNESGDGVRATLSDGSTDLFDLVVAAEGVHSSTRRLVWGEEGYKPFGIVYVAASLNVDSSGHAGVVRWFMGTGQNVAIVPVNENTLLVQIYFRGSVERDAHNRAAKDLLRATFRNFAPVAASLVERMAEGNTMFCDNVAMITLPTLFRGRVVLLGDAGYCPTFLSGMGASLGLIGAKAMQKSFRGVSTDWSRGLTQYDARMQPLIRHFQANAERNAENILSQSPLRTKLRDWALRELPAALMTRAWGAQFKAEAGLVHEILEP